MLDGNVEVVVDRASVRALGPGEFFGELAALDWGAGFGRTRTATVVAAERVQAARARLGARERARARGRAFGAALEHAAAARIGNR